MEMPVCTAAFDTLRAPTTFEAKPEVIKAAMVSTIAKTDGSARSAIRWR